MRVIVDAYGGDNAPEAVLQGCRMAADRWKCEIILTGDGEKLREKAAELGISLEGMRIAEAPDVIPMDAEPTAIMKQYKDCSMARGLQMLADGEGEAFVSAGSTGALVVGGTLIVKRIKGVKRPAIGTVVPCRNGCFMLLDSGANHDCRPEMLRQFGLMGSVYMKRILGEDPDGKIHYLMEYSGRSDEIIDDPWYTRKFDACAAQITEGCDGLLAETLA